MLTIHELKIAYLSNYSEHKLTFNCQNLIVFGCYRFYNQFSFSHSEKMQYLEIDEFYQECKDGEKKERLEIK